MDFQSDLSAYKEALESEFKINTADVDSPENINTLRAFLLKYMKDGALGIVELAKHGESEAVRLSACKYIIDKCLATADDEDTLEKLLEGLRTPVPTN